MGPMSRASLISRHSQLPLAHERDGGFVHLAMKHLYSADPGDELRVRLPKDATRLALSR